MAGELSVQLSGLKPLDLFETSQKSRFERVVATTFELYKIFIYSSDPFVYLLNI